MSGDHYTQPPEGYKWSGWITPDPIWVSVPFQKVMDPTQYTSTANTVPNIHQFTILGGNNSWSRTETFQLNRPDIDYPFWTNGESSATAYARKLSTYYSTSSSRVCAGSSSNPTGYLPLTQGINDGQHGGFTYKPDDQTVPTAIKQSPVDIPVSNITMRLPFNTYGRYATWEYYPFWRANPAHQWDWIKTATQPPEGGYSGGTAFKMLVDQALATNPTYGSGGTFSVVGDYRGRGASGLLAGFVYWARYKGPFEVGGLAPAFDTTVNVYGGRQTFDWSCVTDTYNWQFFHPMQLKETLTDVVCADLSMLRIKRLYTSNAAIAKRVEFLTDTVQLLDSKLIFETQPLSPMENDPFGGYLGGIGGGYSDNAMYSGLYMLTGTPPEEFGTEKIGYWGLFADQPESVTDYPYQTDNWGTKIAEIHPEFGEDYMISSMSWTGAADTWTYTLRQTQFSDNATYYKDGDAYPQNWTHYGADLGIDLLSAYPGSRATFGFWQSFAWDDPISPASWIPDLEAPDPFPPDCLIHNRLNGGFNVLIKVQLPKFRYAAIDIPTEFTPPLRMIQRDDGMGVEQHPRIDSMRANNWSSANKSIRIFNQGDGTYR